MATKKLKVQGLNTHRFGQNPLERKFAESWDHVHDYSPNQLGYLLDKTGSFHPPTPSDRDQVVAATVIQWLGSPVGFHWLAQTLGVEGAQKILDLAKNP